MRSSYRRAGEDGRTGAEFPDATLHKSRLSWALWLIPIAAALLCVWFIFRDFISAGPMITIYFTDASGLQTQNTEVRYRGSEIGVVKSIALTPDAKTVKVTARLTGPARKLARVGSVFWIVRPELKVGSISGLQTIISGNYIEVQPGTGPATNVFVAAESQPLDKEPNALELKFISPAMGSLQEGSPIFYRGVKVGEVDYYQLSPDSLDVVFHGRILQQYTPLVRVDSQFWNAGGINLHAGILKGIQISAESPATLVSGALEFATPLNFGPQASNGATFFINQKADDQWKTWAPVIELNLPAQASPNTNTSGSSGLFNP